MFSRSSFNPTPRWTPLVVTTLLVFGGTLANAPAARADTFCDLSPTSDGVGIDFAQPLDTLRSYAVAVLPFYQHVAKLLPSNAPKSIRLLFAGDLVVVTKATKVTSTAEAKRLAHQSLALSTSASGRAAIKWLVERCNAPDPPDSGVPDTKATKPTTPPTRPLNPARATTAPKVPVAPGGAKPALDPCSLVTEAEATAALGADPGLARRPDASQCVYGPGFADTSSATLTVAVAPYGKDAFAATATMASDVRPEIGEYYQAVTVADRAFNFGKTDDKNPADSSTVNFLKGDRVVVVNIFSPSGGARGHVLAVAITAASRV